VSDRYVQNVSTREAITLRDMRFHARVGILAHEETLPQPLHVDVTVWRALAPDAASTDGRIDYRALYDLVAGAVAAAPIRYLEDLAHGVAESALNITGVDQVRIAVRKPNVALPGPLAHAEIVVERSRDD
jgi:7,8-dihydroneopterin aldolase/epimerase/oxygenase